MENEVLPEIAELEGDAAQQVATETASRTDAALTEKNPGSVLSANRVTSAAED
jgi:hypothetical protein